jgi:hypothetical protein
MQKHSLPPAAGQEKPVCSPQLLVKKEQSAPLSFWSRKNSPLPPAAGQERTVHFLQLLVKKEQSTPLLLLQCKQEEFY